MGYYVESDGDYHYIPELSAKEIILISDILKIFNIPENWDIDFIGKGEEIYIRKDTSVVVIDMDNISNNFYPALSYYDTDTKKGRSDNFYIFSESRKVYIYYTKRENSVSYNRNNAITICL